MRDISEIIKDGGEALERLLREAFDAGRAVGKREAAADLKARVDNFFGTIEGASVRQVLEPVTSSGSIITGAAASGVAGELSVAPRAAPGTVKPEILRLIHESKFAGISTEELIERTGFKPNSVRGTVSTLQMEKAIFKDGDRWYSSENVLVANTPETNKGATDE